MKKTISGIRGIFGDDFNLKDTLQFCNNLTCCDIMSLFTNPKDDFETYRVKYQRYRSSLRG